MPGATAPLPATTTTRTASASIPLNEIASWDGKSLDIKRTLNAAFEAQDYLDCIRDLQARGIEPQSYINSLDKVIDSLPADSSLQKRCTRALRKTCGIYGIFPSSYTIPFSLTKPGTRAFASGGFADVWRVTDQKNNKLAFAVKSLRVYEQDPVETINKKYCKEVIVCKRAKHPNVLSIEGVAPGLFEFCMVSPWMENGNLLQYVAQYPGANRLELLIGVARGLAYLHINEVVHGDLKSANILIDEKGNPRLSDFGLCSITRNIDSVNASTPFRGSTVRYSAPEILDTTGDFKRRKPTNKTDVYSFSMVIVEMATGKMPFPDALDPSVTIMISKGKRPQKPRHFDAKGITSAVWKVAKNCWQEKAKDRPEMDEALRDLEKIAKLGEGLESHVSFRETIRGVFS